MLGFHIKIISRNETTNEYLKGRFNSRNYHFREESLFKRFMLAFFPKKTTSLMPNSLIKQSLVVEKIIDSEKIIRSHGGTPRRPIPGKYQGEPQKIRTINHRKVV